MHVLNKAMGYWADLFSEGHARGLADNCFFFLKAAHLELFPCYMYIQRYCRTHFRKSKLSSSSFD